MSKMPRPVSALFNSPTRDLYDLLGRNYYDPGSPLPSVKEVQALLDKGAKVNEKEKPESALSFCAHMYRSEMYYVQTGQAGWIVNGHVMSKEERQQRAGIYLDIAKTLISAGADPRMTEKFPNGAPLPEKSLALNGLLTDARIDPALLIEFQDLLTSAAADFTKRDEAIVKAEAKTSFKGTLRKVFKSASAPFKSPTTNLYQEMGKRFWEMANLHGDFSKTLPPFDDFLPSVEKVKQYIGKGADVNAVVTVQDLGHGFAGSTFVALNKSAQRYREAMSMTLPDAPQWDIAGHFVTQAEWKSIADRYLQIAKVLVEAGADPRVSRPSTHKYHEEVWSDGGSADTPLQTLLLNVKDPALVKDFSAMLTTAEAALNKRGAPVQAKKNRPSPKR